MGRERPEFPEFFSVHYEPLRRLGYLLSADWGEAEELAQDALVRTFAAWARINPEQTAAAAYARQVLVNRYRSRLRHGLAQARRAVRLRRDEGYVHDSTDDRLVLWAALQRLPARQRQVLVLRFYEDLPEVEVARLLHLPLGTAKSLARRGLENLRRQPALGQPASDIQGTRGV